MSSIYRFREENGRTYHAYRASGKCPRMCVPCSVGLTRWTTEAAYFLPNDEVPNDVNTSTRNLR